MHLQGENGSVHRVLKLQVLRVPGKSLSRLPQHALILAHSVTLLWILPFLQERLAVDAVLAHRCCLPGKVGAAWIALKMGKSYNYCKKYRLHITEVRLSIQPGKAVAFQAHPSRKSGETLRKASPGYYRYKGGIEKCDAMIITKSKHGEDLLPLLTGCTLA